MDILIEHCPKNAENRSEVASKSGRPTCLLDLAIELLQKIISDLPVSTIPNVMVNRFLRPICEQCLYETVMLWAQPYRTLRLLKTFILRPDLALLVRHLAIDASWVNDYDIPDVLKPEGVEAFSLAKNVVSLTMDEFGHWPKAPTSATLRSILSNLTLTSLTIPRISDPTDYYASLPPQEDLNLEIVDEIRAVLQMQPRLEDLYFPPSYLADRFLSTLEGSLLPSDIPSLKSLQAHPGIATSFLAISPGLESLNLFIIIWDADLFSKFKASSATSRTSLRHLTIRVWCSDKWLWENLGKMFALFPNMETLDFTVNATASNPKPQPAKYFFEKIADQSHALQSLQKVEFQYDSFLEGGSDIERESVVTFKRCPHLKTIITPKNQMWLFQQGLEGSAGSVLTVVGPIGLRWTEPESLFKDLPHPNETIQL